MTTKNNITGKPLILIFGGEMNNRGAQAMIFVTVSELRQRFPHFEPILVTPNDLQGDIIDHLRNKKASADPKDFAFRIQYGNSPAANKRLLGERLSGVKERLRACARTSDIRKLKTLYDQAAFAVNISGFALGTPWGFDNCMNYLRSIEVCRDANIPIYLLPQSFGPFNFASDAKNELLAHAACSLLPYPRIVFARERAGFDALASIYNAANARIAPDIVLQNTKINYADVFSSEVTLAPAPNLDDGHNVCIVPNTRVFASGIDEAEIYELYRTIVNKLLAHDYAVWIINHAPQDGEMCSKIAAMFSHTPAVRMLNQRQFCIEYEAIFAQCDFLIASRYHAIVHAYRVNTPCIALGWAEKYHELLALANQDSFAFDINKATKNANEVLDAIDALHGSLDQAAHNIRNMLQNIGEQNTFDLVESDFKTLTSKSLLSK